MNPFRFSELSFHSYGLVAGLKNLWTNHLELGLSKTAGKITQPVNFYSRYPEYAAFFSWIDAYVTDNRLLSARILDVGSPKLFGFYLADRLPVSLLCTDISPRNIDEYRVMWKALAPGSRGSIEFKLEDVRSLHLEPEAFDVVYSMSVIEHVDGKEADGKALEEMLRVLKPGGLLVFSVPIGPHYQEQKRPLTGADHVSDTGDRDMFFQRVYTRESVGERLLSRLRTVVTDEKSMIIGRDADGFLSRYLALGANVRGALGFLNPLLSARYNHVIVDDDAQIQGSYGDRHSPTDVYGDFMYAAVRKR